jgi:hypothetical protein
MAATPLRQSTLAEPLRGADHLLVIVPAASLSLPELRPQGRARQRGLLLALLALGAVLAAPGLAQAQKQFDTSAEACEFLAQRISGPAFLCPLSLPARVTSPGLLFWAHPHFISKRSYSLDWIPARNRGAFSVKRAPKRFLRTFRATLRGEGAPTRKVRVRGHRAIAGCAKAFSCGLGWKERGSAYFVFAYRPWKVSLHRVRRDLRAVAGALQPVLPSPT